MAGTVVFQSTTIATPGPGIVVGQDNVGGTAWQYVKIDVGPAGTSVPASYAAGTGVPVQGVGTFQVLGSVQAVGTRQVLGTIQPLAGSVHIANTLGGTVQVLGSVQTVGTSQVLGTIQPLAGSVHLASGTVSVLGTIQPLAGSVHVASSIPGTVQVLGSVQGVGTFQVLGSVQTVGTSQVLGSVQTVGTSQVLGSVQTVGTSQVLGSVQTVGTSYTKEVRSNAPTTSSVAATVGNIILLAANANRLGAAVYLEGGSSLFLKLGSLSGTLDYTVQMLQSSYFEVPFQYTGTISGIWQFTGGTARVTEIV